MTNLQVELQVCLKVFLMYGVEIWGWTKFEEVERIQEYLRPLQGYIGRVKYFNKYAKTISCNTCSVFTHFTFEVLNIK